MIFNRFSAKNPLRIRRLFYETPVVFDLIEIKKKNGPFRECASWDLLSKMAATNMAPVTCKVIFGTGFLLGPPPFVQTVRFKLRVFFRGMREQLWFQCETNPSCEVLLSSKPAGNGNPPFSTGNTSSCWDFPPFASFPGPYFSQKLDVLPPGLQKALNLEETQADAEGDILS